MKRVQIVLSIISLLLFFLFSCKNKTKIKKKLPRVIITTDINNVGGDPEDKQSLIHLFLYSNVLDIKAIIPDYWVGKGVEASYEVINQYNIDYNNRNYKFQDYNYPTPEYFKNILIKNKEAAVDAIIFEAKKDEDSPLYILVWGNMNIIKEALFKNPSIASNLRVLSIATNLKADYNNSCGEFNLNNKGRTEIFNDDRFNKLWWVESDWTYNGMFFGNEPKWMLDSLSIYGNLGQHIKDVVRPFDWVYYFRAGDTPTVLYLIDPNNDLDNPVKGSWAGKFIKPFPDIRPAYYTGITGDKDWDFENPCKSWDNAEQVYNARLQSLLSNRENMYHSMLEMLNDLYNK